MLLYSACKNQQWRNVFNAFPFDNSYYFISGSRGLDVVHSTGNLSSNHNALTCIQFFGVRLLWFTARRPDLLQTCSYQEELGFSGKNSAMMQILHKDCSSTVSSVIYTVDTQHALKTEHSLAKLRKEIEVLNWHPKTQCSNPHQVG